MGDFEKPQPELLAGLDEHAGHLVEDEPGAKANGHHPRRLQCLNIGAKRLGLFLKRQPDAQDERLLGEEGGGIPQLGGLDNLEGDWLLDDRN
nr:hypothetical protein [Corynebacterium vitaeruminis]